ncbi:MAG: hypothetical protein JW839_10470 [Candidatus Lokiarchaeota archaeon]|nr:hypothetical protein [Candidatus Lokiarchaeota archaeon]
MTSSILRKGNVVVVEAGILTEAITLEGNFPRISRVAVGAAGITEGTPLAALMCFHLADPDERPRGVPPADVAGGGTITQENLDRRGTDGLRVARAGSGEEPLERVSWRAAGSIGSLDQGAAFGPPSFSTSAGGSGSTRAVISTPVVKDDALAGVRVDIALEVYDGFPAVRKWLAITNGGKHWIKVDKLVVDPIVVGPSHRNRVNLTPDERGVSSSVVALGDDGHHEGLILCSEVPSATRAMEASGGMGYADDRFERVIGPGESFETEPTSIFAYEGGTSRTCSSTSTPLDRAVEGQFKAYLEGVVGVRCVPERMPVPLWCTWSNFQSRIDDAIVREQAVLASRAGFKGFQIDAGWSDSADPSDWTSGGREPHPGKFPDFRATCEAVRGLGLRLGLWTSCFRNARSPDLRELPGGASFPVVKRGECVGMSFASAWRYYYADDVVRLHDTLGATYFKQDLTNIKHGDIAEGHDSRTRKESYLRGIRGFFESQDIVHEKAPGACTLLSHELYWGTPGAPCDVAAVKHCWSFHIPPNDYSGAFPRGRRIARKETRLKLNWFQLIAGCFNARKRFYAHRGLPLYCIEYYGAATVNKDGSLTPRVQDRQVCSWLMGIPSVYAGDLSSLTEENIAHYKARFDMVAALQEKHGIFRYFQYSGVPGPTDVGWHWWGKLNPEGSGVVVVMRGHLGLPSRRINVPWVPGGKRFKVTALFAQKELGTFSSEELKGGRLRLPLARLSQEILEIRAE